ncbi:hypothetical protein BU17DRAFT_87240 [Hysterangium stoloniferum]|nr:hypothetical protein BU17DRAFT_87240 [Hysterangium stoloniferum]
MSQCDTTVSKDPDTGGTDTTQTAAQSDGVDTNNILEGWQPRVLSFHAREAAKSQPAGYKKKQTTVSALLSVPEKDEQSAVEQNDFPSDLDFEGAHLSTGEANSDDRVAVNNNSKRLGGGQSLAAAKRGKHVPEPHEKNDDDWLYITAEYRKAVAKKGDDALAEIKFPDKFLQQFSAQKDNHNKMKKTTKSSNNVIVNIPHYTPGHHCASHRSHSCHQSVSHRPSPSLSVSDASITEPGKVTCPIITVEEWLQELHQEGCY